MPQGNEQMLVVEEPELSQSWRAQLGRLLQNQWPDYDVNAARWILAPAIRVIHVVDEMPIANQSIMLLESPVHPSLVIYRLGALLVADKYRHLRIGSRLIERAVTVCDERGADLTLTATRVPMVRATLMELGFSRVPIGSIFWRDEAGEHTNENYYARRARGSSTPPRLQLYEGRF
jgi:GNAT superfamily N-acetyltransferase